MLVRSSVPPSLRQLQTHLVGMRSLIFFHFPWPYLRRPSRKARFSHLSLESTTMVRTRKAVEATQWQTTYHRPILIKCLIPLKDFFFRLRGALKKQRGDDMNMVYQRSNRAMEAKEEARKNNGVFQFQVVEL